MKRALIAFLLILGLTGSVFAASTGNAAQTTDFKKGLQMKAPMIVLLYAPWADNLDNALQNMNSLKKAYGNNATFVSINMATAEGKAYNEYFMLQPKMPHLMMFKDKAKMFRLVPRECLLDYACVSKRVSSFVD